MTDIYRSSQLERLSFAKGWRELVLCDEDPNEADLALVDYIDSYIKFLRNQLGTEFWPGDEFQIRCDLVWAVRNLDTVYRHINKLTGAEDKLPNELQALMRFLGYSSLDMVQAIQALEAKMPPEIQETLSRERASYQRMHEKFLEQDEAEQREQESQQ